MFLSSTSSNFLNRLNTDMKTSNRFVIVALCVQLLFSCDSHRDFRIESSMRAEVRDWGGNLVCLSTPCVMHVSRETCWFFDSSSGYILLTAWSRTGISMRSMAIPTCSITDGMWIMYSFPRSKSARDCAVILYEGDREVSRLRCEDSIQTDASKK
jgi:hypothetical protein